MYLQPEISLYLWLVFLAAFLFYFVIPGGGAFYVRSSWRRFRRSLLKAIRFPLLDYGTLHGESSGFRGCFRFFGRLQAFSGDDIVWLTDGRISVRVHMRRVQVYILSPMPSPVLQEGHYRFPEESPRRIEWSKVGPLPEYTKFYVTGAFFKEQAGGVMDKAEGCPLTAVIYEGEEQDLIPGAIWSGRQKNEYWNIFTPWSLAVGSLLLFLQFYFIFRIPALHLPAVLALTLALMPLAVFAPPGLVFYYVYRSFWRRGREFRAVRDLLRIPASLFSAEDSEDKKPQPQACAEGSGIQYVMEQYESPPGDDELGPEVWRMQVPNVGVSRDAYYLFASRQSGSRQVASPPDPVARAMLIPGDPYVLAQKNEKKAFQSEIVGVAFFIAGAVLNGIILFAAFMYLLR